MAALKDQGGDDMPLDRIPTLLTAMVTPFDAEGEVDWDRARELARKLVAERSEGLVVSGTTGESPTLSVEEKIELFRSVKEAVGDDALVVAGAGNYSTRDSIHLAEQAEEAGVDLVMLVAPYYNRPPQEGLYRHFRTVAEATSLPVLLYNIPSRTACNIEPETVARLSHDVPTIVGIKEASSSLKQVSQIRRQAIEGFLIYSGNDSETLPLLALGAVGVVSVASHIVGPDIRRMIDSFASGDISAALTYHLKLLPVFEALFVPGSVNPAPVKTALALTGLSVGGLRLPLVEPTESQKAIIRCALEEYGLLR